MDTRFDPTTFDPHDPAFQADPYPAYAWFRENRPVHRVTAQAGGQVLYDSHWVFRWQDVQTVLQGKALFLKNRAGAAPPPGPFEVLRYMPPGLFSMDPPRHDQLRPLLDGLFAEAIAGAADIAEAQARTLLAGLQGTRRIELVNGYASPLPSAVLMTVLGIPPGDRAGVGQWVGGVLAGNDYTVPAAAQAMGGTCALALGAYFQALMRGCPVSAGRGMVDRMVAGAEPQGMTREEVQQTALNFAVAGYLSTVFLIATGTLNLLRNPAQLALLRQQPERMDGAIREMLRYDAPAQLVDRYVAADTELGGMMLRAGDKVSAVLGSANHDGSIFPDAERFDITRDNAAQLGFGAGIHHCIGAPLVEQVAPVALRCLLDAFPALALDGLPQWQTDPYLRSVVNLPLAIG